jgi:hypothetical protein
MTFHEIFVTGSLHMENPTKQLFLSFHYICMHALTLNVHLFYPNLALSLTSFTYWLERWSVTIVASIFSPIDSWRSNHHLPSTNMIIHHLPKNILFWALGSVAPFVARFTTINSSNQQLTLKSQLTTFYHPFKRWWNQINLGLTLVLH